MTAHVRYFTLKVMERHIKATSDILIHYLFGSEHNRDLLLSFVNAVLTDAEMEPVASVEIQNPFNIKEYRADKLSIPDIRARGYDGRLFDIEVQSIGNATYANRSLYYWAKNYTAQLKESEDYTTLNPVICINLLDFILMTELPLVHSCFLAMEKENPEFILTNHLEIHYLELPKLGATEQPLTKDLLAWLKYFIHEGTEDEQMKTVLHNKTMEKAHDEYVAFNANDEYRHLAEARRKWQLDHNTMMKLARQEGVDEGMKQVALRMLDRGDSSESIQEVTGLSLEKIQSLREEKKS